MGYKINAGLIIAGIFALTAIDSCQNGINPSETGEDYLAKKGYTQIKDGGRDYFNGCGRYVRAREYEVTTPSGKREKKVVCLSIFGNHSPPFGS